MSVTGTHQPPSEPKGIGGWLLLPLVQLIAAPIAAVFALVARAARLQIQTTHQIPLLHEPTILAVTIVSALLLFAVFGLGAYCLVRFLQERQEVPRLMTIWYSLAIAMSVFGTVLYALHPELYARSIDPTVSPYVIGVRMAVVIILNVGLIAYFATSRRVKNTFVYAATPAQSVQGFGGWLLVTLAVTGCWALATSFFFATEHVAAKTIYAYHHGHVLALVRNFMGIALIALSVFSFVRIMERKRDGRVLLIALATGIAADTVLQTLAGGAIGEPILACAIWAGIVAYFLTSKRVKNTFVR